MVLMSHKLSRVVNQLMSGYYFFVSRKTMFRLFLITISLVLVGGFYIKVVAPQKDSGTSVMGISTASQSPDLSKFQEVPKDLPTPTQTIKEGLLEGPKYSVAPTNTPTPIQSGPTPVPSQVPSPTSTPAPTVTSTVPTPTSVPTPTTITPTQSPVTPAETVGVGITAP